MKGDKIRKVLDELYQKDLKSEYGKPTTSSDYFNAIEELSEIQEDRLTLIISTVIMTILAFISFFS